MATTALTQAPDLWNLLHDGYIDELEAPAPGVLRLRVRCLYLAERFDPPGEAFRIELRGVTLATYEPYDGTDRPLGQNEAREDVDFVRVEDEGDHLAIWGSAGCIRLAYTSASLALDDGTDLTLDALRAQAAAYWQEFAERARQPPTDT